LRHSNSTHTSISISLHRQIRRWNH